ncbi:MAG: 4Fe-4S dicluster domain-containing protein [Dehalococcoidia bacterium]
MTEVASAQDAKGSKKQVSRREFLRLGGAAAAVGTAGLLVGTNVFGASKAEAATATEVAYGMAIDLERCFGCRACWEACKVENNTPAGITWMQVMRFEQGSYPNVTIGYLPRPCMHCDNPPCVKVCPTGARFKRADRLVLTDFDRCIGCRYCEVACPYGVNYFNWKKPKDNYYLDWNESVDGAIPPYKNPDHDRLYRGREVSGGGHYVGVIEKCTFCVHRLAKGLLPACVANCPVRALIFGDLNDPRSQISEILGKKRSFRLLEELDTRPRVFYLGRPPAGEQAKLLDGARWKLEKDKTKLEVRR